MPKCSIPRDPKVAGAVEKLNAFRARKKMSFGELANAANVKQPQVSKILAGKTKKVSEDLRKLCDYAKIKIRAPMAPVDNKRIIEAIESVWDGKAETIELIARLIECAAIVREPSTRHHRSKAGTS